MSLVLIECMLIALYLWVFPLVNQRKMIIIIYFL